MRLSTLGHLALALVLAGGAAACDEGNDTDPPLARQEVNYDAGVASGLGRTYKIALTKKF